MEVHHPHHVIHNKKLKEYFLEFFMLFLAVSLGFLAENIRERYVEEERAHELIYQLKSDIKNNNAFIDSVVMRDKQLVQMFDTAVVYLATNDRIDRDTLYAHLLSNVFRYLNKNDTYDQMKSSGSLRYIKDSILLDKILRYAGDCKAAEARSGSMETDFVTTEYTNVIDAWMPRSVAIQRIIKDRNGNSHLINKESTSKSLEIESELQYIDQLKSYTENNLLDKAKSEELKSIMLPVLTRRIGLITNTVRFMGLAKQSGVSLLEYIEKTEK